MSIQFLGVSGVIFKFYSTFDENSLSKHRIVPDGMPRSATSHLGLFCLPMSHKRDARLICVKLVKLKVSG